MTLSILMASVTIALRRPPLAVAAWPLCRSVDSVRACWRPLWFVALRCAPFLATVVVSSGGAAGSFASCLARRMRALSTLGTLAVRRSPLALTAPALALPALAASTLGRSRRIGREARIVAAILGIDRLSRHALDIAQQATLLVGAQ